MIEKEWSADDIDQMAPRSRARLINSLPGFKSANLIGSTDGQGNDNLAIVSSVIHFGSNPPLLGFVSRPSASRSSASRPRPAQRDSLNNILTTGVFTINSVTRECALQAHQTSARYPSNVSEFDETGLTRYYHDDFAAPFVLESPIKIGLKLVEHVVIQSNQTEMLIGEVVRLSLPEQAVMPDGYLDHEQLETVTISGLDSYHVTQRVHRLSYAKPDQPLYPLTLEGEPSSWQALYSEEGLP